MADTSNINLNLSEFNTNESFKMHKKIVKCIKNENIDQQKDQTKETEHNIKKNPNMIT